MNSFSRHLLTSAIIVCVAFTSTLPGQLHAASGDLYQLENSGGGVIYEYTPSGSQSTFTSGFTSTINYLTLDPSGNLFVGEGNGATGTVTKITPTRARTSFVTGVNANGLVCDSAGNLFVSDSVSHSILKVTPAGTKSAFAPGIDVLELVFDHAGNLYAADFGGGVDGQGKIYKFTADGTKTTFASTLKGPNRLAFDPEENLFVASPFGTVLKITPAGTKSTFASGLGNIQGLACDAQRNVFVSIYLPPSGSFPGVLKFTPAGTKSTFATSVSASGIRFEPPRSQPLNISTRLQVQTGDQALIAGFIIAGTTGKKILIRGIGPSLSQFGINGSLQDPVIELRNASGGFVNGNDNWRSLQETAIQATGLAPSDNRESAFLTTLSPGSWTVVMRGIGATTGVGLLEVYDLDQAAPVRLANISTRGYVQTGENVMIGGFVVGSGNGAGKVVVRAIGPSLAAFGITNAISDPLLAIHDASGAVIATNDDWHDSQQAEIQATGLAPSSNLEAASVQTLPSGNYTAIVSGYHDAVGVGLVEVYNLQ
jgi:sugar lactone lactonase YvrE